MQVSAWLCALPGPSLCQRQGAKKKERALNASFPTFVPMSLVDPLAAPALGGASVGAFIWATWRPLRWADRALLGDWCGQGSARRQRPVSERLTGKTAIMWPKCCGEQPQEAKHQWRQ